jgi:hypothetical protein
MSENSKSFQNEDIQNFNKLLLASGLVSEEKLATLINDFLGPHPDNPPFYTVDDFSQFLVANKVITEWQADKLKEGRYKGFFIDHYILADHIRNDEVEDKKWYATYLVFDTQNNRYVQLRWLRSIGEPHPPKKYEIIELD